MDLYKRVRSSAVLHNAWAQVRTNGLSSGSEITKSKIHKFADSWLNNIRRIQDQLRDERFSFYGERGVTPPKGKGKKGVRPIVVAPVENRIVRRAILDVLQGYGEVTDSSRYRWSGVHAVREVMATPTSIGGIKKRGVPRGIAIIDKAISDGNSWFVRSDIKNFFTRIPKKDVNEFICGSVKNEKFSRLFEQALETNLENKNELEERRHHLLFPDEDTGVAQGSALSALAGNIALREFDRQLNDRRMVCVRYIDDFILLGPDETNTRKAYDTARTLLKRLGMDVYDLEDFENRKLGKVDAGNIYNGTDFLGYRISGRSRQPSDAACKTFLGKVDVIAKRAKKEINEVLRGQSNSHEFRYHQSMVRLHRLVWGWSQSFRHTTAAHVFAQLDKEVDRRINEIQAVARRSIPEGDRVIRQRIMGIHLLADTRKHPLPEID